MKLAASLMTGMLLSSAAIAQEPKLGNVAGKDDVAAMFTKIAACLADTQPKIVSRWLAYLPGTEAEDQYVMTQEGALTVCMDSGKVRTKAKLTYDTNELRPFIAVAAARSAAEKAAAPLALDSAPIPWFTLRLATMQPEAKVNHHALVQQDFGHCVVVANASASRNLILSQPGSTAESSAVAVLAPLLGPCLPAGTTVELTKTSLRRAVSEPYYHLVTDPKQEAAK